MAEYDTDRGYLLDNQQSEAGARFGALAELFDPGDVPGTWTSSGSVPACGRP
ncbi:hypothetical protein [Streptomyces sp. NPDC059994]|uniref:hypothetical protein n=1 Tax=Streptomyces sp. NPDC059994 TaxID=3347029 RepID=UPI0036791A53